MFIEQKKPKDYDCGYNLDLMITAIPQLAEGEERNAYVKRVVGLIKQSHPISKMRMVLVKWHGITYLKLQI